MAQYSVDGLQPLDHGVLSLPLAKRGDINAELDRYKASAAKAAGSAARQQTAENKKSYARFVDLLDAISDERMLGLGKITRTTKPSTTRAAIRSLAVGDWTRWVSILERAAGSAA